MKCGGVAGWDGTGFHSSASHQTAFFSEKGETFPTLHPPPSAQLHLPHYLQLTEYSRSHFHVLFISHFQAPISVFTRW